MRMERKALHRLAVTLLALFAVLVVIPQSLAKTTVAEKDCVITITLNIQISGAGATDAVAQKIKSEIENCYNGQNFKYDCCKVKFVVNVKKGGASDPNFHQIKIVKDPGGKYVSNVKNPLPKPNGSSGSGTWSDNPAGQVYAHEAGHLMGLKDKYKTVSRKPRRTKPCKGHEKNKMATLSGKPQQSDVNKIIKDAGVSCPDKCKKGKAKSSDSGTKKTANVTLPTTGETVFVALDPQATASTTVEIPVDLGGGVVTVGPFAGSLTVMIDGPPDGDLNPLSDPTQGVLEILEFDFFGPPVELPSGEVTGDVILALNTADDTRRSLGEIDVTTGDFEVYINGFLLTELFGLPMTLPFESLITGHFDEATGLLTFQCETLITVFEEADLPTDPPPDVPPDVPDAPLADCNHNGIEDEKDIENGRVLDLDANGVPDPCQASREMRFFHGEPAGGTIQAKIGGYHETCLLSVPTYAGETCDQVMTRFAAAVGEDECLAAQGISAEAAPGRLSILGLSVYMEEEMLDPGIQRLRLGVPLVVGP